MGMLLLCAVIFNSGQNISETAVNWMIGVDITVEDTDGC
jgi:hypothetical protein